MWHENIKIKNFPKLNINKKTDILIIGGGIAGILCAYFLEQQNINYILVEARKIGMGITKNTTAKITFQNPIYKKLIKNYGVDFTKQYLETNKNAIQVYENLCQNIDCDFTKESAITYSVNDRNKLEEELLALQKLGYNADFLENVSIPIKISGAIEFKNQAQFNPLKFIAKISENLNIHENTFVYKLDGNTAFTENAKIQAKKIIIATHFPFVNSHGSYFLKMYQDRSYVLGIQNAPHPNGMYVDAAQNGMSFRNYNDLLLIGGGGHRTGKSGGGYTILREFVKKYYPNSKEKYFWSTQDCMTLDGIPYIGHYSKNTPNWFVATGFNKWGMTASMISAKILSDMVLDKKNDFSEIFSPSRSILKPQLFANLGETIINFCTPTVKRCSHLGCALKWNKYEHSWDCPCHGSRFNQDGKIIDNPAKKDTNV